MQRAPRIPELTLCNRFVRQAIAGGVVYGISDGRRLADVQSRARKALRTTLLWTVHGEAERWASVLIDNPSVLTFSLSRLACEVFPQLDASGHLVGTDWSADPIEPEVDPVELLERLRNKALECFLLGLRTTRVLSIIEDADGPVVAGSVIRPGGVALPCFIDREDAERYASGLPQEAGVREIELESFISVTAPWLAEQGWLLTLGTWGGPGAPEIGAADAVARIVNGLVAA